VEYVEN